MIYNNTKYLNPNQIGSIEWNRHHNFPQSMRIVIVELPSELRFGSRIFIRVKSVRHKTCLIKMADLLPQAFRPFALLRFITVGLESLHVSTLLPILLTQCPIIKNQTKLLFIYSRRLLSYISLDN